jgi:hypothetical protein
MNKSLIVMGCIAWAGVAMSSATEASAKAGTYQGLNMTYASCSASSSSVYNETCGVIFHYQQNIQFVQTACNTGGCAQTGGTYVDFLYPAGRKTASFSATCTAPFTIYNLGTCAC